MPGARPFILSCVSQLAFLLGMLLQLVPAFSDERLEHFENKIRPVLVAQCLSCHGEDPEDLGGGLSLMSVDDMREGGDTGPAIDGESATATMLIKAMRYEDEIKMPPDGKLSDEVIRDFEKWINDGAVDPRTQGAKQPKSARDFNQERQHWAFQPLAPKFQTDHARSGSSFIDSHIDDSLRAQGLVRSERAGAATLLKRLCYDLTGLPPTREHWDRFLAEPTDEVYFRIVDELLASEEFGRHWGRHWLDVARYADSNGSDFNATFHEAWRYRDYVIDSFNQDKPFDRFLSEQIAGDLMTSDNPQERTAQLVATGFLMLGPKMLSERDKAKLQMDVVDDQIDTIGRAVMGLTLGCARCHDHKFDPVPTTDYYALAGIFRSTQVLEGEIQKYVSNWIEQPLPTAQSLVDAHNEFKQVEKTLAAEVKTLEAQHKAALALADASEQGLIVDDVQAKRTGAWVESTYSQPFIGKGYIHDDNRNKGNCSLQFDVKLVAGKYDLSLAFNGTPNRSRRTAVELIVNEKAETFMVDQTQKSDTAPWKVIGNFQLEQDSAIQVIIKNDQTDGYVIVDALKFVRTDVQSKQETKKPQNDPLVAQAKQLETDLKQAQMKLTAHRAAKPEPLPKVMAVRDAKTITDAYVCIRGEVHLKGETVPRGFLQVCQPSGQSTTTASLSFVTLPSDQSGRLQLAQWLCDPDHPLTARVFVNRVWSHLFGEGLVRTVDNFGLLGDRPSHPELLDQLASDFLRSGWSVKRLVRDMVSTDTYRQSTLLSEAGMNVDPENRLLWRMNRKRRSAESIRDALLAATNRLDRTASVSPVSNFGTLVTENVANPKEVKTVESARRTVYLPIIRGQLSDLLTTFDFADPDLLVGKRERTNVPSQALLLMNGAWIQDQVAELTAILTQQSPDRERFIRAAYLQVLSREPSPEEIRRMADFLESDDSVQRQQMVGALVASSEFRLLD